MKSAFFSEEHRIFRESVRQFMEKEIFPFVPQWEKEGRIPPEIWRKLGQHELLGINYSEAYGGTNADIFNSVIFLEELGRSTYGGFTAAVGVHQFVALSYISKFGSDEQKKTRLVQGIAGEKIGALAISEPDGGSDIATIRTKAVRQEDEYIINGTKTFITNGVYGDFIILATKTDPDAGAGGISLFLIDADTPGVRARKLHKLGWHSSDTAEISFDDVRVPATGLIGQENQGYYYIMDCSPLERLVAAITAVAGAERCLEVTIAHISQREVFNKPLSHYQVIRHTLSDLATELEAARQLTYHACWLFDRGEPAIKACTMAKLHATELAKRVADSCLQYFGGYGYMQDYAISRMFRDARVGTIVGGASEIMREILSKIMIDHVDYQSPSEESHNLKAAGAPEPDTLARNTVPTNGVELPEGDSATTAENQTAEMPVSEPLSVESAGEEETLLRQETSAAEKKGAADTPRREERLSQDLRSEEQSAVGAAPPAEEKESPFPEVSGAPAETVGDVLATLPSRLRPEKALDARMLVHFNISGERGGDYTVLVDTGDCNVRQELHGNPDCVIATRDETYLDIEAGITNPQVAFMLGKIKASNVTAMMQFFSLFRRLSDH